MIKRFFQLVNEDRADSVAEVMAGAVLKLIKTSKESLFKSTIRNDEMNGLAIDVTVKRSTKFSSKDNARFSDLPWEELNYQKYGFVVDGISVVSKESSPLMDLAIVLDPSKEPACYEELYFKVLDCLRHELDHILNGENQTDSNRERRLNSENSYKYFLLPDEIPSMVAGMKLSADRKKVPLRTVFSDYLQPMLKYGFITKNEYDEIMMAWSKYAVLHYSNISR